MPKLYYGDQLITSIMTNHSMSIDDALKLNDIDPNETDENGDLKYDYELFRLVWDED